MAQIATRIAAFAALFLALNIGCSSAQDRRQNEPGQFDFYVLSLSWAPSFCDAATERSPERAAPGPRPAMRRTAVLLRGPRVMAAIRKTLSGILPEPGAAARPQYRVLHARHDAEPAADLPRGGSPRPGRGPAGARLFRHRPQGPRDGEDSAGLSRSGRTQDGIAEGGRGRLRGGQSGPDPRAHRDRLRCQASQRRAHLPFPGSKIPQLP